MTFHFRRIRVAVLKILTCMAISAGIQVAISYFNTATGWHSQMLAVACIGGFNPGLFVGIIWAIKGKAVWTAFVVPILCGLAVSGTAIAFGVEFYIYYNKTLQVIFLAAPPTGVIVGIICGLARARNESITHYLSSVYQYLYRDK